MLKTQTLFLVITCSLVYLSFSVPVRKNVNIGRDSINKRSCEFDNLNDQKEELYDEILEMINIKKKKNKVNIEMNSQLDSSLICFDQIKNYIEGNIIRIFYHDSEDVYFNYEDFYTYLEENNFQSLNNCMADGPDGTDQVYLKNRVMLLFIGQWDGGDDSDTTYVPSEYFELNFYLMKLNQPDSAVISGLDKWKF